MQKQSNPTTSKQADSYLLNTVELGSLVVFIKDGKQKVGYLEMVAIIGLRGQEYPLPECRKIRSLRPSKV